VVFSAYHTFEKSILQGKVLSPAVMIIIQYGGPRSSGLGIMWL
jgi:hypothetical protein